MLISKTHIQFNMKPMIEQVLSLPWASSGKGNWAYSLNRPVNEEGISNDPWIILDEFVNTPLGDALQYIERSMGPIGETKLRKLETGEAYHAHTDIDDRYHLAITTNPHASLIDFEANTIHHVPVDGYLYYMDTSIWHTAGNWGEDSRIHLHVKTLVPRVTGLTKQIDFENDIGDPGQRLWFDSMDLGFINNAIKTKDITGITIPRNKQVLVSGTDDAINTIINNVQAYGYTVSVTDLP